MITVTIPNITFMNPKNKRLELGIERARLARECQTEFIMYQDRDIELNEPLEPLMESLKDDIGMAGYCIEGNTHHLQMGNAMLRTEVARKINWFFLYDHKGDLQCNCLNAKHSLQQMGLQTLQLPSTKVKHLRGQYAVA